MSLSKDRAEPAVTAQQHGDLVSELWKLEVGPGAVASVNLPAQSANASLAVADKPRP